jgi:hypothetical protein
VGTTDIVSQDLETGHGVRLGFVAEHEIAHLLIGVGLMGSLLDLDESGKNCPGAIAQGIVIEEITCGTWRKMILEGTLVDLAVSTCGIDREHDTARAPSPSRRLSLSPRM